MINFFGIQLNKQEFFIGTCLQFPFVFVIDWWVILIMPICGLLWSLGGAEGGRKEFRRLGVPLTVCLATYIASKAWLIFFAIPFMIWLVPSYGKTSWLYQFFLEAVDSPEAADFLTRVVTYILYWVAFGVVLFVSKRFF